MFEGKQAEENLEKKDCFLFLQGYLRKHYAKSSLEESDTWEIPCSSSSG
jgi:hypothetical protein